MTAHRLFRFAQLVFAAPLAWVAGCGDSSVYKLNTSEIDLESIQMHACFDGAEIELVRYASRCQRESDHTLTAKVEGGVLFDGAATSTLDSPCEGGPGPAVDVFLEHSSLIFDFSNVNGAGRFPEGDFEGYVLEATLRPEHSLLLAASVDRERTTLPISDADLHFDRAHIEIDFGGVRYDADGFLKVDLWFANVSAVPDDAE